MLKKALGDQADLDAAFAWRAFTSDPLSPDILSLKDKRPSKPLFKWTESFILANLFIWISDTSSTGRGSAKKVDKKG